MVLWEGAANSPRRNLFKMCSTGRRKTVWKARIPIWTLGITAHSRAFEWFLSLSKKLWGGDCSPSSPQITNNCKVEQLNQQLNKINQIYLSNFYYTVWNFKIHIRISSRWLWGWPERYSNAGRIGDMMSGISYQWNLFEWKGKERQRGQCNALQRW